jgi:cytochrome oxidase Cu insertion factor (SCO1/SenC/PrrC family)
MSTPDGGNELGRIVMLDRLAGARAYEKRKAGDSYTVDHSAQSYVVDPKERLRLFVRHDRISADLADDLKTLLKET